MTAHSSTTTTSRGSGGDKRERILDAAERVFAKSGFFSSRVAEIAREAGIADGTIYLYFKSKDELLISLFESRMERVNTLLQNAIHGLTSPRDKLVKFIETHLLMIAEHRTLAEVLTIELRQSSKFMKQYSNPRFGDYLDLLADVIAEGQQAGELSDAVPAPIAARAIFGMLDELALAWLLGGGEKFDIVRAAEWVSTIALSGLERKQQ